MAIIGKNNHNRVPPPFRGQREKVGSHALNNNNHGVRAVDGGTEIEDQEAEVQLVKRGWLENLKKNLPDKFRSHREAVDQDQNPESPIDIVLVGETSEFDLEKELSDEPSKESEVQIAKRGWLKKIWDIIKGGVGDAIGKWISSRALPENDQAFEDESLDVALPDDIVEVDIGNGAKPDTDETDTEKEIQLVKRGWFNKIRRKIKNTVLGAAIGSLMKKRGVSVSVTWTNNFKREGESEPSNKLPQGNLPLLLKTLRLRPGTADEITKIVEELGEQKEFQDLMVREILDDKEDFEVPTANGKGKRKCRLIGRRIVCRRV